jgi:hypothetical protein
MYENVPRRKEKSRSGLAPERDFFNQTNYRCCHLL